MSERSWKPLGYGVLAALVLLLVHCSKNSPTSPDTGTSGGCSSVSDLSTCLPSWQEYSPKQASEAPTPTGQTSSKDETGPLERIDSTGALVSVGNVTFVCTDSTFNFVDNPEKALSFNIDETKIWPGALIQGKTHRDGTKIGDLQELPIRERAPLTVTLSFNNNDNTRTVDNPEQGSVHQALGDMIGNAQADSLATANNITFKEDTYSSEKQAAAAFGVSGRYLGFEASAKGSLSSSVSTSTVVATFQQQMYIAGVTQPSTPADFFSDAFTADKLKQQEDLHRIGPDNPPLYVSRIGYGRMMVFSMSAKASATDVEGALNAAYKGIAGGAAVHLSAKDSAILSTSEFRISQVGGDQSSALRAIQTGQLADYFTDTAPLTSAAPLWFELKTLTGETAEVSEPGTYTQTTCVPKLPGTFDYQKEQVLSIPFTAGTQRQTLEADVNGDHMQDLVFDELQTAPALNIVHVALANGDGTYTLAPPDSSPYNPAEGWENYKMLSADVDGDGRADLVWNTLGDSNVVYIAMSNGDGTFDWRGREVHTNVGWGNYTVTTGDLNGDGKTDLLWTNAGGGDPNVLRSYFGLAQADTTFSMIDNHVDKSGNYGGYNPAITANFDNRNGDDFSVSAIGTTYNNTYVGLFMPASDSTGTLSFPAYFGESGGGWGAYVALAGDVDGTNGADMVFAATKAPLNTFGRIYVALNNGNGTFTNAGYQNTALRAGPEEAYLADFNNDGRDDILKNFRSDTTNQVLVGFGTSTGKFAFPAGIQYAPTTPSVGWLPYDKVFVGDVNGDGKADIVWTNPSSDAHIYVALAK
ncbi:MAG: FG-GAP-like repeat-containing protein [Gemmatimonadota bacterium]